MNGQIQQGKSKIAKGVFLIPFFDKDIDQLMDTIESIRYYIKENYYIICINDCRHQKNIEKVDKDIASENIINFIPEYEPDWPRNTYGSLFCKKYQAIEYAFKHYKFDYLVGMDTDALITGSDLFEHIDKYFGEHSSKIGLIGSYKIKVDGKRRTRWQWALIILYTTYITRNINKRSIFWTEWIPKAKENEYKLGEHILGGAFIFAYKCIKEIINLYPYKLLLENRVYLINIGDDVIFSLLTFASGFKIGDFARLMDPMAIALDYLPISKERIIEEEKQLIHSVKKGLDGESEDELRTYFRILRK
jgi:hypothetical protein